MSNAFERWAHLRASQEGDGVIEIPSLDSGVATGFGMARYAIGSHGEPRLLVPTGGLHRTGKLPSTSKLSVGISSLSMAAKTTLFIDVMCLDRSLDPVFAELAEDILRRLVDGDSPQVAVINAIRDFRELLREPTVPNIAESVIVGLLGELFIMHRLALIDPTIVHAWMGPFDQRHDFRREVHALEVKTSTRVDSTHVSISGIDQLEPPLGGRLLLAHVQIERTENGEISLASLVEQLLKAGVDKEALQRGLTELGCTEPEAVEWNWITFIEPQFRIFDVRPGFPAVVRSAFANGYLPLGVTDLKYSIDLDHAKAFELAPSEINNAFERIAR
jgi:hypothetical protein